MTFRATRQRDFGSATTGEFSAFGFEGLLNLDSLPHELADNELSQAVNVYGDVPGGVRMRRGMTLRGTAIGSSPIIGLYRFYQQVYHGSVNNPPTYKTLAQVGGTLWDYDNNVQIGATNALGVNAQPWSAVRVYDPNNASGATDSFIICTGVGGPYLYDGNTISVPSGWSAAAGARWCTFSNSTLWFGGIPAQPTLLWQSQPNAPTVYGNSFNTSYPVTGLSKLGAGSQSSVVFGMTYGLGITFGVNLYNLYYQEIPFQDGVVAGRTMIAVDGIVYFLGDTNIYRFDGQNIIPVGKKVRPWIINDPTRPYIVGGTDFPMNGNRALSFSWYYNQFIYFAYDSGAVGYCNAILVYHINNGGFTVLTGPKIMSACLLDVPGVDANPHACIVGDATIGNVYNWDQYSGSGPDQHNVSDNGNTIYVNILTKYFRLTTPGTLAALKQIVPEIFLDTMFTGNFQISADYGNATYAAQLSGTSSNQSAQWNNFNWDEADWAGGSNLSYFSQAIDLDQSDLPEVNSIAFGIATNVGQDTNDTNPPFVFCGVSGEYAPATRRTPAASGAF